MDEVIDDNFRRARAKSQEETTMASQMQAWPALRFVGYCGVLPGSTMSDIEARASALPMIGHT